MSPFVGLIIKQLPRLLPVVESLVKRTTRPKTDDDRLDVVEQSIARLAERSQHLEVRLRRMTLVAVLAALMALTAVLAAFMR